VIGLVILTDIPCFFFKTELDGLFIRVEMPDLVPFFGHSTMLIESDSCDFDAVIIDLKFGGFIVLLVVLA
jgi:hypothetical protein